MTPTPYTELNPGLSATAYEDALLFIHTSFPFRKEHSPTCCRYQDTEALTRRKAPHYHQGTREYTIVS